MLSTSKAGGNPFFAHRPAWRKLIRGWISRHVYNHGAPVRLHEPVHAVFRPQVELFGMECHVRVIEPAFPLFHCSGHLDDVFWLVAVASQCRFHVTCESAFRTVAGSVPARLRRECMRRRGENYRHHPDGFQSRKRPPDIRPNRPVSGRGTRSIDDCRPACRYDA